MNARKEFVLGTLWTFTPKGAARVVYELEGIFYVSQPTPSCTVRDNARDNVAGY